MNQLDALLLVFLVAFAIRGWWRGLCRETFAIAGLLGGVIGAAAGGPALAAALEAREVVPPAFALPAAWGVILAAAIVAAAILGRLAEAVARALFLGTANRVAGALFGCLKGAAIVGFGLLFVERVVPSPAVSSVIAGSQLGRPLEQLADTVVERGRELGTTVRERRA